MRYHYDRIVGLLSKPAFTFLNNIDNKGLIASGFKTKGALQCSKMYHFLVDDLATNIGVGLRPSVAKALAISADNETGGFRRVRECGFPLTVKDKDKLIDYLYYKVKYCDGAWAKKLGNHESGARRQTTMEADGVRFRGTWWIQITGRTNFERVADRALNLRRQITMGEKHVLDIISRHKSTTTMTSVELDLLSLDPYMGLFTTLVYLSGKWNDESAVTSFIDKINGKSPQHIFASIGYDNETKKNIKVPSLDDMMARYNGFKLINSKITINKKGKNETRTARQSRSRRFELIRSNRT